MQPVMVAQQRSATSPLAYFLQRLLRPVVDRQTHSTTFANGSDVMRKLQHYANEQHRLRPRTIFAVITITNFYTMVSHASMLLVLEGFLNDHLCMSAIDNISVRRLIELTSLFLESNRFHYDGHIYRCVKGSPTNFPLTETLAIVYAFQWQKLLLREELMRDELFGR
jgi:hypothetical protein